MPSWPSWLDTPAKRYRALLIALVTVVVLAVLVRAYRALVPFIFGFFLAYLLVPLVDFFDRHSPKFLRRLRLSRKIAIVLVYLLTFGAIAGILAYIIPALVEQSQEFAKMLPSYTRQLERLLTVDIEELLERIPQGISRAVQTAIENATSTLVNTVQRGVQTTLLTLWQTVSFIIGVLIIPIWLFYVLNDADRFRHTISRIIPPQIEADVKNIVYIVDKLLSAYLRGQLIVCFLVGFMATILLLIFRINMALLLGTLAGIFEIIPFLGPWIGALPAVLLAFLRSPMTALWVALGYAAIQQIESNLLSPRISGSAVRFHPAIVMILIVIGSEIGGVLGVLLAVPVSAVLRDVFRYLYLRTTERGATPEMAMEILRARGL